MDIEILLFTLRIASAGVLLIVLSAIFYAIWQDYRVTVEQMQATRRSYGQLVAMMEVDDQLMLTGETYPLLPLTSMGRAPTNTIRLEDSFASGEHPASSWLMGNGGWKTARAATERRSTACPSKNPPL